MRQFLVGLAAVAGLAAGCPAADAAAAPSVEIRQAAVRVVVLPEPRSDVKVVVLQPNPRLPLRIWRSGERSLISGELDGRIRGCQTRDGEPSVVIEGLGETPLTALPYVAIHTPLEVRVSAGGAVWGEVGRSAALLFSNTGCGDWVIANVRGHLRLSLAGSGRGRAGDAGYSELLSDGSGAISARRILAGVVAMSTGSGDIDIAEVDGPFTARVAGSGAVRAAGGHATRMSATIAGSGGVTLDGLAESLDASIIGSGDVRVGRVAGAVKRSVIGSGRVRIGS